MTREQIVEDYHYGKIDAEEMRRMPKEIDPPQPKLPDTVVPLETKRERLRVLREN